MIEGLDLLFKAQDSLISASLKSRLEELIKERGRTARFVRQERIKSQVYRLHLELDDNPLVFILKCMEARIAHRTELVAGRWFPAVGLEQAAPPLLSTVATTDCQFVWHIYSDLGSRSLAEEMGSTKDAAATVRFVAMFHQRFIAHPYLPEFRLYGADLGLHFVESNLRDAMLILESITKYSTTREGHWGVVDRLSDHISAILRDLPSRRDILKEFAGPETLLHGDLWPSNVFVASDGQVRLIDWDRAGAGPIAYDLSTFVLRFPPQQRVKLVEMYRKAMPPNVWEIPTYKDLNLLFETFEFARYACLMIWPAIAVWESGADWAIQQLEEVDRWFQVWEPVFPSIENPA